MLASAFFLIFVMFNSGYFKCQRQLHTCFIINNAGNFGIPAFFFSLKKIILLTWITYLAETRN